MATKTYVCTNYANCDLALSKTVLEIEDGEEVVCSGCKRTDSLQPAGGASAPAAAGGGSRTKLALAGVAVLLVVGAVWFFFLASPGPDPEGANLALTGFFQRLK